MQTRLTAAIVRRLLNGSPPAKVADYFDTGLPRFFLRLRPPTRPSQPFSASFYVRNTVDGIERRAKVADAHTVPLEKAQDAAKRLLARADLGGDPARERRASRDAWTIREAIAAYLASPDFARKAGHTRAVNLTVFNNHILPRLGGLKLAAIDVPAIRRLVHAIETDHRIGAHGRRLGGAGAARTTVKLISVLLNYAIAEGRLDRNPLAGGGLRLGRDGVREVVITSAEEYRRLFTTLDRSCREGHLRPLVRVFFILAAATGCRRSELQHLRWADVDLAAQRLVLRHTKGARLARDGVKTEAVGLPPIAAEALAQLRAEDADPAALVFPPAKGRLLSVNRDWRALRREADLPAGMVLHGLRHSVGSIAAAAGMSAFEVQRLLRHRSVATAQRYIHWSERHHALLAERAMGAVLPLPQGAPAVDAVPFRQRGR
jgi:integrase